MSTAQPTNQTPILEESAQQCRLCLPSLTDLIVLVDLVPLTPSLCFTRLIYLQRRLTSNLCFQLGIRVPRIQFAPKLELKHKFLQSSVKSLLPEYTTIPVPTRPIVQYQSSCVHFPEFQSPTVDPVSTVLVDLVVSATCCDSARMRRLLQYRSIAVRTGSPVATSRFGRSLQLGLSSQLSGLPQKLARKFFQTSCHLNR